MASRSHRGSRAAAARASATGGAAQASALRGSPLARAPSAREHASAALLLGLLALVYVWPALVQGRLLSPTALLYTTSPWQHLAPHGVERWINGDLGDVPLTYYPWDVLARRLIHAGTFPAWNPYAFGGTPLWANSQIAWLSPFSLPLWLLPLNRGLGVAAALKLWTAGFGTYLLARELRLGFWPAIVAGSAFALCSFDVLWLSYGVFASVAAMLPWALWLTERIVRRGRSGDGLALAAVLAIALTGGHPGTQVHVLAAVALYALVRAAATSSVERRARATRLALVGGSTSLGLLLAAVVLVPAQEAAAGTFGTRIREHGASFFAGSHMPLGVLRTALFPDWWGRPSDGIFGDLGPAAYRERTFYAGAATLVLALVALASPSGWRRKAPFALLGALGIAIAVRTPGLYDLVIHLPGFDRIQNSRIYLWFVLAAAVLAGFGLQRAIDAHARLGRAWAAPAAALLLGLAVALALTLSGAPWHTAIDHALRRTALADRGALALASALWWLVLAGALTAILLLARRSSRWRPAAPAAVALLVALDMLHFAHGAQPMGPPATIVPPATPAIAYLQRHAGDARIAGVNAMTPDVSTLYGLRDVGGFDAPQPTLRFADLWGLVDPTSSPYDLTQLAPAAPQVLGLLGARYLLLPPGAGVAKAGPLHTVYAGRDGTIVANRLVAPRAFVTDGVHVAPSEPAELATVGEARFDPRREAVVRADEVGGVRWRNGPGGSARIASERNDAVTLRATTTRPAVVVLGDAWAPGWSVEVDGRPARALQANVVLRGVAVAAGTHEIAWRYRVPGLRLGEALSALGLLVAAIWGATLVMRARRLRRRAPG
jgi:hypothetical protein